MNCDVKAYEGNEPFIFISYAHSDAHLVYPMVERLVMDGYRVWYDDGIHVGEDWTEAVAARLDASSICLAMLSENSVASVNCRNELAYSLSEGKILIGVKLTDFEMPRGLKLQLGNVLYIERYRYGETEFYERLQISHGVSGCRAEEPRITDAQLMAWRNKWANATPIKRAKGEPERVKLKAPSSGGTNPAPKASRKPLAIGLAAAAVVLAILAIILLPRLSKESPAPKPTPELAAEESSIAEETEIAEEAETPQPTEEIPEVTPAPVILDKSPMDVIAYECTDGFDISDLQCSILGRGQTAQLEFVVNWADNQEVNSVYCFLNQSEPIPAGTIATFQRDFYKMSNSPLMTEGEIAPSHTAYYGNVPAQGPIYLLLFCFDENGQIIAYITVEVDYPQENED